MSDSPAVLARLAAGLVLLALLAPPAAHATHRVALPVSPTGTSSTFLAGSSDGSKVLFSTNDALLPDLDQDSQTDIYLREGGRLTLISDLGGQSGDEPAIFRAATPTLSHVVWETEENFQLDLDNSADLYMWSAGQVERVTAGNSFSATNVTPYFNTRISTDGARVTFSATENLGTEADTTADVYEYVNLTNQLRLVSKPSVGIPVTLDAVSANGTRVFMSTAAAMSAADTDALNDVYVSINGAAPILLSPSTTQAVTFAGASSDGTRAYFHTTESLDAVLDTDANRDVYETIVGGAANKLISAGNGPYDATFQRVSADGSRVFYTTREQVLPADDDGVGEDGYDDVYMREADVTTLITGGETIDGAIVLADISPDGQNVFWYSGQSFGDDADGGALDAWRWNEGVITRISVGEINDQGDHDSSYAGRSADLSSFVFLSDGQLTSADTDTRNDLYLRAGGTTTLLTPAPQPCNLLPSTRCVATYNGISADGGRVWFTSEESLHPADTDDPFEGPVTDVYESRVVGVPLVDTTDETLAHLEGEPEPIDPGLDITEATNDLFGASVQITAGFEATDVLAMPERIGFTATLNAAGDTLTILGRGTVEEFEDVLRSVTYQTTSETAAGSRTVEFRVDNGGHTGAGTRTLTVAPTDDPPVLEFLSGAADYTNGAGPVPVADLKLTDADTTTLTGATVKIVGGFVAGEDEIGFTPVSGVTHAFSDDGATLTFSGTASLATYEALLKSVTYSNDSETPTEGSRTFEYTALSGAVQSTPLYHALNVFRRNIDVSNPALVYTENAGAVVVDPELAITNFPTETISGATVEITQGFAPGQDLLGFVDQNGITGTLSSAGDELTLAGDATVAQYLTALRSVTYRNLSEAPTGADRVIRFAVTGGLGFDSRTVDVVPVEDAPVVAGFSGTLTFTEGGAFLPIAPEITVADVDSPQLTAAAVRFESGRQPDLDHLSADLPAGLTSSFDDAGGTLTITGAASPATYQTALRSIVFFNDSEAPTSATRQLSVTVTSGTATSAAVSRGLNVVPVNDPPVVGIAATPLTYTTGDDPVAVDVALGLSDPDSQIQGATVKLLGEPVEGEDVLEVADRDDGIAVTVDDVAHTVTLIGAASPAAYRNALRDVLYSNRSAAATGTRTVQVQVTDGAAVSAPVTRTITLGTAAPELLADPAIEGVARVGAVLTAFDGAWAGSEPLTLSRQWQRCAESGTGCAGIDGATGATYAPTAADAGFKLRLQVVADNPADGTVTALSPLTAVVRVALAAPLISAGPPALTPKDSGVVRFSGEEGATFTCAVDAAAFTDCSSPLALAGLADGVHRVRVRQHREGLTSPEAERSWTVDTTAPGAPSLLAGPDPITGLRTASIGFAGLPGERFECAIDGGDFAACESPVAYADLDVGVHTVLIRAVDAAGNAGAPLRVRWTVGAAVVNRLASKVTVRAPKRISRRARSFQTGCALDAGVLRRCDVIARVRRGKHLVRIGRGRVPAGVTGRSATVTVKLSRAGRRALRRAGRGARIRVTAIALQAGSSRSLVDTASLRAR